LTILPHTSILLQAIQKWDELRTKSHKMNRTTYRPINLHPVQHLLPAIHRPAWDFRFAIISSPLYLSQSLFRCFKTNGIRMETTPFVYSISFCRSKFHISIPANQCFTSSHHSPALFLDTASTLTFRPRSKEFTGSQQN
jgi:hypothetical protein